MSTYYKVVSQSTYLKRIYDADDVFNIPTGTKITASAPFLEFYDKDRKNGRFYIDRPVVHFCDNAFDTMLWYNIFYKISIAKHHDTMPVVYKIIPISDVIKERCHDNHQFYQCGAHIIEFKEKVALDTMFKLALVEFLDNPEEKTSMYPKLDMNDILEMWAKHEQPTRI